MRSLLVRLPSPRDHFGMRRRYATSLLLSAFSGALLAAMTTSGAHAAIRSDCGGRAAQPLAESRSIALVVRERGVEDDLYGGDHRYSACYGKHGRTRMLLDLTSPNYPTVGRTAFWKQFVALEIAVDDATCGKYSSDPCPTARYVSAWDAKTGRQVSHAAPETRLEALAVSPRGALAWTEPALPPATGTRVRAVFGELGETTLATSQTPVTKLAIGRTEVRWTDADGAHWAPVPARSILP